jgi:hypothetical protein
MASLVVKNVRVRVIALLAVTGLAAASHADVKPGDVVTAKNAQQVRGLIPDELVPFTIENFPDLDMKIVATESYTPHSKYVEATVKYACQAKLGPKGELLNYTAGQPFPYSEWAKAATEHKCDLTADDPQIAVKLAWNFNFRWQAGGTHMPHTGQSFWRGKGDNTWKIAQGEYRRTYFSHRADLLPETTELVPGTNLEFAEYNETVAPFDIRGQRFLVYRYKNAVEKDDDIWAYIPSMRRVRRLASSERADSLFGTDFTFEDLYLFSGHVWEHDWKFEGDPTVLAPMDSRRTCFPRNVPGWKPDEIARLGDDAQFLECKWGPYSALPFVGETWQKRTAVRLEQRPKRANHPYSRRLLWYDKETFSPLMAISWDRDGKPFRVSWYVGRWSENTGIASDRGTRVNHMAASMVANVRDHLSNLFLFYTANAKRYGADESLRYFDTTRLKAEGR